MFWTIFYIFAGLYFLVIGLFMRTENFRSLLLFKLIPIIVALGLFVAAALNAGFVIAPV